MAISDAQFTAFLSSDVARVVLAELTYPYESAGARATGTIYLCSGRDGYRTGPAESPASVNYRPVLTSAGFAMRLDVASLGGTAKFTPSSMVIANADGAFDFMKDLIIDGWEVNFYLGAPTWARSDFRKVMVALMDHVSSLSDRQVSVALTDKRLLLGREVRGALVGGSDVNATKDAPLLWGFVLNVDLTPYLYDSTTLEYTVISNYGSGTIGMNNVRDSGVSLCTTAVSWTSANTTANAATDVITHVAHGLSVDDVIQFHYAGGGSIYNNTNFPQALDRPFAHAGVAVQYWVKSVPTADTFTLSLTKGGATLDITGTTWAPDAASLDLKMTRKRYYDNTPVNGRIQLSSKAAGRVTGDVQNNQPLTGAEGDWVGGPTTPFNFAGGLMYGYGNIAMADIDTAGLTAADTALGTKCATGLTSLYLAQRQNLIAVLNQWLDSVFGFFGQDNTGKLIVGLVDPSGIAAATATRTLAQKEIFGDVEISNLQPTISTASVQYDLNHAVQKEGVVSSVSDALRTFYASEFGSVQNSTAVSGTAYSTNKPLYHKTMTGGPPQKIDVSIHWPADGVFVHPVVDFANEIVADRAPHLQVLRCTTGIDKYAWKVGEVASVTHARFGLSAGKNFRVVGVEVDLIAERVSLDLLTQTTPTYTTASYTY